MTLALLMTAASGAWADETPIVTITATSSGPAYSVEGIVTLETGSAGYGAGYGWVSNPPNNLTVTAADGVTITKVKFIGNQGGSWEDTESPFQVLLQGFYVKNASGTKIGSDDGVTSIEVYGTIAPAGPEVTINDTKTEASFEMPQYDVTATYTIKRDISVDVTATMGDGTDGVRYRVKKAQQGEGYEPAEMDMMQVLALVAVNDGIEQKALTLNQDYFCRIYKLDEQTLQPTDDGVMLYEFDFAPGLYALKAFAKDDSDYAGETALSNTFQLFQGYQVVVPAGEFITYYKDEPLYADTETSADAQLYTISSVSADQATLSAAIETAPSLTPLLVYNSSDEAKTFLLIPANEEPNLALTVAPEFQGTLTGTTIAASTEAQTNYAFNGKAFVFVKNAIEVGPNKAWLSVNTGVPSARITIVFDSEATGIRTTDCTDYTDSVWYDLNGRKVAAPTKKGIYIMNGRKVVVK